MTFSTPIIYGASTHALSKFEKLKQIWTEEKPSIRRGSIRSGGLLAVTVFCGNATAVSQSFTDDSEIFINMAFGFKKKVMSNNHFFKSE